MDVIFKRLESKSILIVEDDESTLKWLGRVLSLYFYKVYQASDPVEALEIFKNTNPDIILADIQMPDIDGLSLLHKIKSLNANTFRIIMTAFNNSSYINDAVETGIHLYLKKPIDIDELLFAISSHIPNNYIIQESVELGKNFIYDFSNTMLYKNSKVIKLTKKELLLLELFLKNRHGFISLELMEQTIWEGQATPDAIRMVLVGLRKKLYNELFENLKGLGYKINLP